MPTISATTLTGIIIVAAALLAVAAQAPVGAPGPAMEAGAPGPMLPGAPGPAVEDCPTSLLNMTDCLSYVELGSNLTTPDKGCCPELAGLVESHPVCLCLLFGNTSDTIGIEITISKALKLPSICGVQTPPVNLCAVAGYPVGVPMPSVAPSSGSAPIPTTGNSNNGASSGIGLSQQLSILVGLTTALLTTLF